MSKKIRFVSIHNTAGHPELKIGMTFKVVSETDTHFIVEWGDENYYFEKEWVDPIYLDQD